MDGNREPSGELPGDELEREEGEELPPREAMSVVRGNVAIPLDPELAASILAGDEAVARDDEDAGDENPEDDDAAEAPGGDGG